MGLWDSGGLAVAERKKSSVVGLGANPDVV